MKLLLPVSESAVTLLSDPSGTCGMRQLHPHQMSQGILWEHPPSPTPHERGLCTIMWYTPTPQKRHTLSTNRHPGRNQPAVYFNVITTYPGQLITCTDRQGPILISSHLRQHATYLHVCNLSTEDVTHTCRQSRIWYDLSNLQTQQGM